MRSSFGPVGGRIHMDSPIPVGCRALMTVVAVLVAVSGLSAQKATFRWFEYCPGVERHQTRKQKSIRAAEVAKTVCYTDSFAGAELDGRWSILSGGDNDGTEIFSLTPAGLQLIPTYVNLANLHYPPSAIFLEPAHGAYIAACEVAFRPEGMRDFAGMALYADAGATIIFGRGIVNGHQAILVRRNISGKVETSYQPLQPFEENKPVWLRLKSYAGEVSFFYSTNRGDTWIPVANNLPLPAPDHLLGLYATTNPR